jgi:hypothetical protein
MPEVKAKEIMIGRILKNGSCLFAPFMPNPADHPDPKEILTIMDFRQDKTFKDSWVKEQYAETSNRLEKCAIVFFSFMADQFYIGRPS